MRRYAIFLTAVLGIALAVTGCAKKVTEDQSNLTGTGFDSLATTEELSQLPQAAVGQVPANGALAESLPIEVSPVTQASGAIETIAPAASDEGLSYQQKIQTALKNAGLYNGAIDGKIGPASRKAIEDFQKNNGLTADGKVGPKTWAVLEPYLNGQPSSAASVTQ